MKRVLIFSLNYFPKYVGGAEVAIKEIVERLDKNKFEFHMLTLRFDSNLPKYELLHGIHIHRIGFTKSNASISDIRKFPLHYNKYYYQLFAVFYAVKLHIKHKFDFTWAMMAHSCGVPAGMFKLFFPKVKYILNLQEGDPPDYIENLAKPFPKEFSFVSGILNKISFWFFQNAFRKADVVQSLSTYLNKWAVRMGNKKLQVVIPNAVNYNKFATRANESEVQKIKNEIGFKDEDVWLVTTSRLVVKNAVDNVIESLQYLSGNVKFLIIGIGPEEERLKKLVKVLKLEDRVRFYGEVQNTRLVAYLNACDIFVRSSRSEGFGISFVEAMASGLPVVATLEGGISDFLFDEKTGFVCEKDNPKSIANAVNRILKFKQENILQQILVKAKKMVQEKYDWDIIAKRMEEEVFDKI